MVQSQEEVMDITRTNREHVRRMIEGLLGELNHATNEQLLTVFRSVEYLRNALASGKQPEEYGYARMHKHDPKMKEAIK